MKQLAIQPRLPPTESYQMIIGHYCSQDEYLLIHHETSKHHMDQPLCCPLPSLSSSGETKEKPTQQKPLTLLKLVDRSSQFPDPACFN